MPEIIVKLGDSIVQKNIFIKESIRIGRVPDNEIVVENLAVSRYHAVIEFEDDRYILTDLDSSNGTFVNGVRIKKTELQDRDVITIGKHKLYFYDQRGAGEVKQPRASVVDIEPTVVQEAPAPPPQAELEIIKGRQKGTRFVINGTQTSIGRGTFNDIQLTDWFVSKVHATIERRGNEFVIRDLGSWRHTYVNGIMVHELPLADGDIIQMGPTVQLSFNLVRQEMPLPSSARVPAELQPSGAPASQAGMTGDITVPDGEATEQDTPAVVLKWSPEQIQTQPDAEPQTEEAAAQAESLEESAAAEPVAAEAATAPLVEVAEIAAEPPAAQEEPFDAASALAALEEDLDDHAPVVKSAAEPVVESAEEHPELGLDEDLDLGEPVKTEPAPAETAKTEDTVEKPSEKPRVLVGIGAANERISNDLDELDDFPPLKHSTNGAAPAPAASPAPAPVEPEAPAAVEPEPVAAQAEPEPIAVEAVAAVAEQPAAAPATPAAEPNIEQEIQMWERALKNKNPIIRKQAARQLQKLTGKQYDYS